MKTRSNFVIFSIFFFVFLMIQPLTIFSELIAPTRTLEGQQKPMGQLSVFSEPPKLHVFLNGVNIGKTPIISKEITSGTHLLRVKDSEKKIIVLPGKSLQLSFFKDVIIEIPEKKAQAPTKPKSEIKKKLQVKKSRDSKREKEQDNPLYWPMNPLGPIR